MHTALAHAARQGYIRTFPSYFISFFFLGNKRVKDVSGRWMADVAAVTRFGHRRGVDC